jgi:hypothetical protein
MFVKSARFLLIFGTILCLILVDIVLHLLAATTARADVGVRPILPGGSNIEPQGETPVQMAAEKVVMDVRLATEADNLTVKLNPEAYGLQFQPVWFPAIAEVNADFTMRNPTKDAVSITAWFPLASALEKVGWELNPDEIVPRIESFRVLVDANPVNYTVSELPNPKGADKPLLPWASFPVTFPATSDTNIHVSYKLPLQPSVKGSELALYYIFQTGAGWARPIGQAELILNLPYPASVETMAGTPSGSLDLPYGKPEALPGLPPGSTVEGNQARWIWKDFEPGPKNDFSVWLIDLEIWQKLQTARAAVRMNPMDGLAWLDLASIYRTLSTTGYNAPSIFSPIYLSPGIEAYQKAAGLLPEHPAPHAGQALLMLAPYMTDKNAPPDVIETVQKELGTARELEEKNPSLAEEAGISSWIVEDVLSIYFHNDATATAEWSAWSTDWAKETTEAMLVQAPSETPKPQFTPVSTLIPSETAQSAPTALPVPQETTGNKQILAISLAAGIVILILVGYLVLAKNNP